MGKECLQIFLNLKLEPEQQNNVEACIQALEAYFKPQRNVVYERYQFNMCMQNPEETIDSFINRLRKAASMCQFGTLTEELIRDQLVIGLKDHSTKLRLLKEEGMDLNKALSVCRSNEAASQQLEAMKPDDHKTAKDVRTVNDDKVRHDHKKNKPPFHGKDKNKTRSNKTKPQHKKNYQSFHCGGKQRHKLENCPAFKKTCKKCSKANHFASVCRSVSRTS